MSLNAETAASSAPPVKAQQLALNSPPPDLRALPDCALLGSSSHPHLSAAPQTDTTARPVAVWHLRELPGGALMGSSSRSIASSSTASMRRVTLQGGWRQEAYSVAHPTAASTTLATPCSPTHSGRSSSAQSATNAKIAGRRASPAGGRRLLLFLLLLLLLLLLSSRSPARLLLSLLLLALPRGAAATPHNRHLWPRQQRGTGRWVGLPTEAAVLQSEWAHQQQSVRPPATCKRFAATPPLLTFFTTSCICLQGGRHKAGKGVGGRRPWAAGYAMKPAGGATAGAACRRGQQVSHLTW